MKFKLRKPKQTLNTELALPASKSISNRLLIIHSLSQGKEMPENLSDSDDTSLMIEALQSDQHIKDVGPAGTTMRFLTAYYSCNEGMNIMLTGSSRMKERPIGPLVDALRLLGADIKYDEKDGFPPIEILGKTLQGGEIDINGSISSQFISALLLIAPSLKKGLKLNLKGDVVSSSYIKMTLELMKGCGVSYSWEGNCIVIPPAKYKSTSCRVESDWSAASYWYTMCLADANSKLLLSYLYKNSLQGDSDLVNIFNKLGVISEFNGDKLKVSRNAELKQNLFTYDFSDSPDIVQSMAVALCLSGIPFHFTGTQTLLIKETNRIEALRNELAKLGFVLDSDEGGSYLAWNKQTCDPDSDIIIKTYHDHRMAMAFAVVALFRGEIIIEDPMVVTKSYPNFWEDLKSAGFEIDVVR